MPLSMLVDSVSGVFANLQACLPNKAFFTVIKSLKPKPPLSFLNFNTSHLLQCRPAPESLFFHQKFTIFCSMAPQTDSEILKTDIAYCGTA